MADADAGNDRIHGGLARRRRFEFGFDPYFSGPGLEIALDHVSGYFHTFNREGLREWSSAYSFQGFGRNLAPDRKLNAQVLGRLPVFDFVTNPDGGNVFLREEAGGFFANKCFERLHG